MMALYMQDLFKKCISNYLIFTYKDLHIDNTVLRTTLIIWPFIFHGAVRDFSEIVAAKSVHFVTDS